MPAQYEGLSQSKSVALHFNLFGHKSPFPAQERRFSGNHCRRSTNTGDHETGRISPRSGIFGLFGQMDTPASGIPYAIP